MRPDVALALGLFWAVGVPQLARRGVRGLMPRLGGERVIDLGGGFGAGPQDLDRLLAIRLYKLFGGLFDRGRGVVHTPLTWVNETRSADSERFQAIGALARGVRSARRNCGYRSAARLAARVALLEGHHDLRARQVELAREGIDRLLERIDLALFGVERP